MKIVMSKYYGLAAKRVGVVLFVYLFDPADPCSYSLPVSAAPAVPFVIPLLLAFSAASWLLVVCPPSAIFWSLESLLTAVGSCCFIFACDIVSFSLYFLVV